MSAKEKKSRKTMSTAKINFILLLNIYVACNLNKNRAKNHGLHYWVRDNYGRVYARYYSLSTIIQVIRLF